jgi:hypothetical protein
MGHEYKGLTPLKSRNIRLRPGQRERLEEIFEQEKLNHPTMKNPQMKAARALEFLLEVYGDLS